MKIILEVNNVSKTLEMDEARRIYEELKLVFDKMNEKEYERIVYPHIHDFEYYKDWNRASCGGMS